MRANRQHSGPVLGAVGRLLPADRAAALVCPSFVVLVFSVVPLAGCSREPANAAIAAAKSAAAAMPSATDSPLYCPPIDLGVVYPGEVREHRVWLENRSDEAIEITKIETSCECVAAGVETEVIDPKGRTLLICRYESEADSDFRGGIAPNVQVNFVCGAARSYKRIECQLDLASRLCAPPGASEKHEPACTYRN